MSVLPSDELAKQKQVLRGEMKQRLRTFSAEQLAEWSQALRATVAEQASYASAKVVALFDAMPGEPDLGAHRPTGTRRFLYPRRVGERLDLVEISSQAQLVSVAGYRFREPAPEFPAYAWQSGEVPEVDLILVPGLAFTKAGHRLGRGGGYYDRLLASLPRTTRRLGVCFGCQLVEEIPCEPHDARVDAVLSAG